MQSITRHIITGVLTVIPLFVTVWIVWFVVDMLIWTGRPATLALSGMVRPTSPEVADLILAGWFQSGLALLLDWSVPFAVTALTVTNGWLFLPTSDLVWMKRRGYVSPAFVRLAHIARDAENVAHAEIPHGSPQRVRAIHGQDVAVAQSANHVSLRLQEDAQLRLRGRATSERAPRRASKLRVERDEHQVPASLRPVRHEHEIMP